MTTSFRYYTVEQAAHKLGVRVDEIYRLRRSGRLVSTKVSGRLYISIESVEDRLKEREHGRLKSASRDEKSH